MDINYVLKEIIDRLKNVENRLSSLERQNQNENINIEEYLKLPPNIGEMLKELPDVKPSKVETKIDVESTLNQYDFIDKGIVDNTLFLLNKSYDGEFTMDNINTCYVISAARAYMYKSCYKPQNAVDNQQLKMYVDDDMNFHLIWRLNNVDERYVFNSLNQYKTILDRNDKIEKKIKLLHLRNEAV